MPKKYKPTIAVDFDGVIGTLADNGFFEPDISKVELIEGAAAALAALVDHGYHVVVHSSRAGMAGGREQIIDWLNERDIRYHEVTAIKPPALAYVDDRAIRFDNWTQAIAEIGKIDPIGEIDE